MHFLQSEEERCPGFKYVLNEVLAKQVFNTMNEKLAANLTLDFEDYVATVSKAQDKFFGDKMVRSQSFSSLVQKGQSAARLGEDNVIATGQAASGEKPAFFSLAGGAPGERGSQSRR